MRDTDYRQRDHQTEGVTEMLIIHSYLEQYGQRFDAELRDWIDATLEGMDFKPPADLATALEEALAELRDYVGEFVYFGDAYAYLKEKGLGFATQVTVGDLLLDEDATAIDVIMRTCDHQRYQEALGIAQGLISYLLEVDTE